VRSSEVRATTLIHPDSGISKGIEIQGRKSLYEGNERAAVGRAEIIKDTNVEIEEMNDVGLKSLPTNVLRWNIH